MVLCEIDEERILERAFHITYTLSYQILLFMSYKIEFFTLT